MLHNYEPINAQKKTVDLCVNPSSQLPPAVQGTQRSCLDHRLRGAESPSSQLMWMGELSQTIDRVGLDPNLKEGFLDGFRLGEVPQDASLARPAPTLSQLQLLHGR